MWSLRKLKNSVLNKMIFQLTNGKKIKIQIKPSDFPVKTEDSCRSKLQFLTGQTLRQKYPFDTILEDFYVDGENFYLDFFIPGKKLAVEVQGIQHQEYTPFFHKNQAGFKEHIERDQRKLHFCKINRIKLKYVFEEKDLSDV